MKTCKNCNNNLPAYLKYCPICGTKQSDSHPRLRPVVLIVLATGFIGGVIVLSLVFGNTSSSSTLPAAQNNLPIATTQFPMETQTPAAGPFLTETPSGISTATRVSITFTLSPTAELSHAPTLTSEPTLSIGSSMISEIDGVEIIYVPEGEFLMGSNYDDNQAQDNEFPQHTVSLDSFWIDQTEITNKKYALCIRDGNCELPSEMNSYTREVYFTSPQFENYPVIYVSWFQSSQYCSWAGRRLPTEAEWEFAARGSDGRIYPWGTGTLAGTYLNFADINAPFSYAYGGINDGYADTSPVGNYPQGASPYGVLDMSGNVWEWLGDWYDESYYSVSLENNPVGPTNGGERVLRGGSWSDSSRDVKVTRRLSFSPSTTHFAIGFRCAMSAE
jgi:eukaryotic-like serine/threonine-protein kinase